MDTCAGCGIEIPDGLFCESCEVRNDRHNDIQQENEKIEMTKEMTITYSELPIPQVGQRVRLVTDYDFDPAQCVKGSKDGPVGEVVSVSKNNRDEYTIDVRMDETFESLADFDNCITFYPECGPTRHPNGFDMDTVEDFHYHCEYIPPIY